MSLHRQMYLSVFNLFAKRSIEFVGIPTSSGWRTAPAIEKGDFDPNIPGDGCDRFFGAIDGPVGHQIATVFGTIRESEHHGLLTCSALQMLIVQTILIKLRHGLVSRFKIVDSFE